MSSNTRGLPIEADIFTHRWSDLESDIDNNKHSVLHIQSCKKLMVELIYFDS